jgi:transposase
MDSMVAIGVDTHRDQHVAVALERFGRDLGSLTVAADASGYAGLWQWASGLGDPLFAVEGTGSYGAGLTRFLVAAGATVFECERPRRRERRQGKSDLIDATLAARRLLSGERLARPRGGGVRDDLRLLLMERQGAVRARTAALNELQAAIVTGPETLRSRFRGLDGNQAAKAAAKLRERKNVTETAVAISVLRRIAIRARRLSREIDEIDEQLGTITSELVPELLQECGVGPVCAAQLVVSSGDPSRMTSEASFAALAGTSPVQASSGQTQRHRLNRGGDRQLNRALHVIALSRVRYHEPTASYYQRLLATGKTPREARRCVKRQLARYFHHRLQTSPNLALTP